MGVLPLLFKPGTNRQTLGLDGSEVIDITGLESGLKPRMDLTLTITRKNGLKDSVPVLCRIDTLDEVEYFKQGGVLFFMCVEAFGEGLGQS